MTGIEVAAIALVVGARSAIKRRREGPSPNELMLKQYLAEQRINRIRRDVIRDLRDLDDSERRGGRR